MTKGYVAVAVAIVVGAASVVPAFAQSDPVGDVTSLGTSSAGSIYQVALVIAGLFVGVAVLAFGVRKVYSSLRGGKAKI